MRKVKCRTLYNQVTYMNADKMVQRPSVYGLVVNEKQLLVSKTHYTQLYVLPGGGIENGEEINDALVREVQEETGISVEVDKFLRFHTDFFYYDPLDLAIHGFLFYYACTPLSIAINQPEQPDIEDLDDALWVETRTLKASDFQAHGDVVMQLLDHL